MSEMEAAGTDITPRCDDGDGALKIIRKLIYEVEVNPESYKFVNEEISKVTFLKWHEKTKVNKHIGIDNFPEFIIELQDALKLPEEEYKELVLMHKRMEKGEVKHLEVKFDRGKLDTRYVFFAVYKRGHMTDMVYAIYLLDAEEQQEVEEVQVQVDSREKSLLWGLFRWNEPVFAKKLVPKGMPTMGRLQQDPRVNAFFRYKALEGFANEGLVDKDKLKIRL